MAHKGTSVAVNESGPSSRPSLNGRRKASPHADTLPVPAALAYPSLYISSRRSRKKPALSPPKGRSTKRP
jgi:hypothetical protein